MQSEPVQSPVPPPDNRPRALTDDQFDAYCTAIYYGRPEAEVMAEFGIGRREYWRVRAAAARRQNRELWAHCQMMQESTRRHKKWEALYARAMNDRVTDFTARNGSHVTIHKTFGSERAMRRFSAYHRYDQNRQATESQPA